MAQLELSQLCQPYQFVGGQILLLTAKNFATKSTLFGPMWQRYRGSVPFQASHICSLWKAGKARSIAGSAVTFSPFNIVLNDDNFQPRVMWANPPKVEWLSQKALKYSIGCSGKRQRIASRRAGHGNVSCGCRLNQKKEHQPSHNIALISSCDAYFYYPLRDVCGDALSKWKKYAYLFSPCLCSIRTSLSVSIIIMFISHRVFDGYINMERQEDQ